MLWSKAMLWSSWSTWEAGAGSSSTQLHVLLQELALSSGGEKGEKFGQELVTGGSCSGPRWSFVIRAIEIKEYINWPGLWCSATLSSTESGALRCEAKQYFGEHPSLVSHSNFDEGDQWWSLQAWRLWLLSGTGSQWEGACSWAHWHSRLSGGWSRSFIHDVGCILNYYLPGARTSKGRRANKSMWRVQSWNSSVATWLEEHSVSRPASPGSFSRLPFNLLPSDQVVMFQVVSMVARPRPPASSAAAIGLPEFVSLYSTCWAATPCERWIWLSTQELEGGL